MSRFSVENFLSQIAEKSRGRTRLCFKIILVSKFFALKRYHDFFDLFCLTVPKSFVGGPLCFRNVLISKSLWIKGITILSKFFVSGTEIFVGNPSMIHKNLAMDRFYAPKRSSTIFGGKFLVSQYRKTSWGTLLYFRKVLVRKKIIDKKAVVTIFRRKFFVTRRRKTSWPNPSVFQKNSSTEKSYGYQGVVTFFRRKLFVQNRPKNNVGGPFCVSEGFW